MSRLFYFVQVILLILPVHDERKLLENTLSGIRALKISEHAPSHTHTIHQTLGSLLSERRLASADHI